MLLTETGLAMVEHLERQKDIPSLLQSFQTLVRGLGMNSFCIGDPALRAKHEMRRWDGVWPDGWAERYASQEYFFDDPLISRLNASPVPFRWSRCHMGASAKGLRMVHEARELGMKEGLAVPIHGAGGVICAVTIG